VDAQALVAEHDVNVEPGFLMLVGISVCSAAFGPTPWETTRRG